MLKAELHTHIKADPLDGKLIKYDAYQLIDRAKELNFDVLAITCHNFVYESQEAKEYARKRGIILLSGAEVDIKGKHTLVYNATNEQLQTIKNFQDLQKLKTENPEIFVIAPHPFHFDFRCLKKRVINYLELFDAWEYNYFYTKHFNPNQRTLRLAKKYQKPIVGNSDVHVLEDLGKTYTLINSVREEKEIFSAIKLGKTEIKTSPLTFFYFLTVTLRLFSSPLRRILP